MARVEAMASFIDSRLNVCQADKSIWKGFRDPRVGSGNMEIELRENCGQGREKVRRMERPGGDNGLIY